MHHTVGAAALVSAIAFVFGKRTAQIVVGTVLITAALAFAYVMLRIIAGTV